MYFQINEKATLALINRRKRNKMIALIVTAAAVLVVIGVVLALMRTGRAFSNMKKTLDCKYEVHVHDSSCYDEEGNLICGLADYVAHTHDESCYNADGELICSLPEIIPHEHDDSCYLDRLVLVCGCEEGQVIDSQGNPVFDAEGNPIFDIADVPAIDTISVEGEVEGEDASAEENSTEGVEATELSADGEGTPEGETEAAETTEQKDESAEGEDTEATDAEATDAEATDTEATDAEATDTEATGANNEEVTAEDTSAATENAPETVNTDANDSDAVETTEESGATQEETVTPEEEIISETVDIVQNAEGEEQSYSYHVHTSECYQIVRELVCTQQTLHVHTADCYDENGKLICGQLQLVAHVHTEDCFTYSENEIVEYTQEAVAGNYKVTAKYDSRADIPEGAALIATEITRESNPDAFNAYEESIKESTGNEDEQVAFLLDIYFVSDGERIEPNDSVTVTVTLLNEEDYETGDQFNLTHFKDDGSVESVYSTPVNDNGETTFESDSFSTYAWSRTDNYGIAETQTWSQDGYKVTVSYDSNARLNSQKGDKLSVALVTDKEFVENFQNEWRTKIGESKYATADFILAISFVNVDENGNIKDTINPNGQVRVTIDYPASLRLPTTQFDKVYGLVDFYYDQNNAYQHSKLNYQYSNRSISFNLADKSSLNYVGGWINVGYTTYRNHTLSSRDADMPFTDYPEPYYKKSSELGIAGNFHLVAFSTLEQGGHINGNILAKTFIGDKDWGTNQYPYEVSYIQDYRSTIPRPDQLQGEGRHVLVLGDDITFDLRDNNNCLDMYKNGKLLAQLEGNENSPSVVDYVVERNTKDHPFINLEEVEAYVKERQVTWASYPTSGATVKGDTVTLNVQGGAAFVNISADDISKVKYLKGFDNIRSTDSIIFNIDCTGKNEDYDIGLADPIKIQDSQGRDVIVDGILGKDGQLNPYGETGDFTYGKVIYNFIRYNNGKVESAICKVTTKAMNGMIVIPDGKVEIAGNTNGTVIADYIHNSAESHRTDFIGTTVPANASIRVFKNVDGNRVSVTDLSFTISEIGGTYTDTVTVVENGVINFKNIKFDGNPGLAGKTVTHYYQIKENAINSNYLFDDSIFILKMDVVYASDGSASIKNKEYYRVTDKDNYIVNGQLNTNAISDKTPDGLVFTADKMVFNNSSFVEIPVDKNFVLVVNQDTTEELTDDLPYSITYVLYRVSGDSVNYTDADKIAEQKVIASENGNSWNYVFKTDSDKNKLPKTDKNGNPYKYFVAESKVTKIIEGVEQDVTEEYKVSYSQNSPYVPSEDVKQVITNKKYPNEVTDLEVEKKFFFESLESEILASEFKGKVLFDLYQVGHLIDGTTIESSSPYNSEHYEVTNGIKENDDWKLTIKKLPKKEYRFVEGKFQAIEYTYYIKEFSCEIYRSDDENSEDLLPFEIDQRDISAEEVTDQENLLRCVINNIFDGKLYIKIDKKWLASVDPQVIDTLQTANDSGVTVDVLLKVRTIDGPVEDAETIGTYVIGVKSASIKEGTVSKYLPVHTEYDENWTMAVYDLPKYSYDANSKKVFLNDYFVEEGDVSNTSLSYVQSGDVVKSVQYDESKKETFIEFVLYNTHRENFVLPETGGTGRNLIPIYIAGAVVILSLIALLAYRKKLRRN